jgi:hypothetical protein
MSGRRSTSPLIPFGYEAMPACPVSPVIFFAAHGAEQLVPCSQLVVDTRIVLIAIAVVRDTVASSEPLIGRSQRKTCRVQAIAHSVVIGLRHVLQQLRSDPRRIDSCSVGIAYVAEEVERIHEQWRSGYRIGGKRFALQIYRGRCRECVPVATARATRRTRSARGKISEHAGTSRRRQYVGDEFLFPEVALTFI